MASINQPQSLTHNGENYTLASGFLDQGKGFSEGPFYTKDGESSGQLYLPDLNFTHNSTPPINPSFMHRVQS